MSLDTPQPNDAFLVMRNRAYDLADTGRYKNWSHVAYVLLVERFAPALIKRLNQDGLAILMISRICKTQRHARSWRNALRAWLGIRSHKPS